MIKGTKFYVIIGHNNETDNYNFANQNYYIIDAKMNPNSPN